MEFHFGMLVVDADGDEAGTLDHVLIAPLTREVTHIVVRSQHVSEDVLLSISLVQGNAGSRLVLHAASSDLANMPRYYEGRTTSPPAGRVDTAIVRETAEQRQKLDDALNVQPDAREYGADTVVTTIDQSAGRLVGVAADQYTNRLAELRVGELYVTDLVIPERLIGELGTGAITVNASRVELERVVGSPVGAYVHRTDGEPRAHVERDRERE
jgi:hypothetical protein